MGQNTAESAAGAAVGYGIMKGMMKGAMKGMPKFASVTFSKSGAQIMLSVIEGSAGAGGAAPKVGSSGSGCTTLKSGSVSWGGRSAKHFTMRCKQGSQWQYTESATMQKGGAAYSLIGFVTLDSADDAAFNSSIGNAFQSMLSGTQFR